jgi:hypothetical protein
MAFENQIQRRGRPTCLPRFRNHDASGQTHRSAPTLDLISKTKPKLNVSKFLLFTCSYFVSLEKPVYQISLKKLNS